MMTLAERQVFDTDEEDDADIAGDGVRFFTGAGRARHHGRARYGEEVSGAALAVEFMKYVGAEVIFGIPGGTSLPLADALTHAHHDGALRYILTGHEQGAAFEAEGYAAASGRAGFCTATSGPGAANLITGLADALRDSRPVVALTGNVATTAEAEAFQALDIVGITHGKATKASVRPMHPAEVQDLLVHAYHTAVTGRPGSVLVDLPKDVQVGRAPMRPWEGIIARYDWSPPRADDAALEDVARLLASAERPVLYVGHGVVLADAAEDVRLLSHRHGLPVVTTIHGLGVLPADDALNLGWLGMHGNVSANLAPYLADLVIALGARFDDRVVGARPDQFAPHARVVHIDVDPAQLNRVRRADLAIHGDVKDALRRLLELLEVLPARDHAPWIEELNGLRRALPTPSYDLPECDALGHEFVYAETAATLAERDAGGAGGDAIATFDVGTHQMKGAQWFPISRPRSFITSGGMGSMGCALPMAVGAVLARPGATVLAFVGDGGFVMSAHELDTIGGYALPVKIVLFDDASLGMVTNWHGLFYEGRALTSDRRRGRAAPGVDAPGVARSLRARLEQARDADDVVAAACAAIGTLAMGEWPLFAAHAAAYGIPAERVHSKGQYRLAIRRALAAPGPYLVHVALATRNQVYPLMEPGTTPQDIIWRETTPGSGVPVHAHERFDYIARRLRPLVTGEMSVERDSGPSVGSRPLVE